MDLFVAFRLHAGESAEDEPSWLPHTDWCETPDPLREPLSRDKALELIAWDRSPGDKYSIRKACNEEDMT